MKVESKNCNYKCFLMVFTANVEFCQFSKTKIKRAYDHDHFHGNSSHGKI